ncbi:type VII secretion protein EssC [Paenibacillus soyae]|uniref:Type VII secretion protein EssC n=1 Tax=Paenibacillus soyae TaxID=2969249 RepID=A0A9X2MN80_9BACL|nr:type VII secretion protein EssC [Paenibacillus soyae]MCR2803400.1 type VII secretion protein EssC [Paenibacillus soyae]
MHTNFSRQPRFLPDFPSGTVEVPAPPTISEKPEISWFSIIVTPAVMLVLTIIIALTMKSMWVVISIAMTLLTLIGSLASAATQIRKFKRKKKEREEKYTQFIADTRSELAIAREQQTHAMNEMYPNPAECVQRIGRTDNKLWEKTPSHRDFLSLRLGLGSAPLEMRIQYTKQAIILETDPLLMEPQRLALEFEKIPQVPITVNLPEAEICGIAGESEKASELLEVLLLQIVTHHGYDDVRVVLLASEETVGRWSWTRFLPHLWDDGGHARFLLCGKAMAHQTLSALYDMFREREMRAKGGAALPHYVFVVEDATLLENERISQYLYKGSASLGLSTIFVSPHKSYLPMNCNVVVDLQSKSGEKADRRTGEKTLFTPDQASGGRLEETARKLAPLRIKSATASFSLPSSITLLDMLEAKRADEVDVASHWRRNKTYMGMSVPIGAKAGGEPFHLDMHETGFGPHGLVAGTTGSGKSELLQSIIVSQAIHFHPHDVVFVLIDYKGGGMADVFRGMPHLVGTITNLDGNQTTRALLSIKSELLRRQRVFSQFGVNNIDKYQKLYYSGRESGMPPIPHLIMIADEFAELKQDKPDFMKELVSTARVGRSLGVHLILATQKPAGVVDDQIWSNSKFKICLKVQDEADSRDVIKRPDAALIKEPGRAYIQVGNDEVFELFQSTFSGAGYDPDGEQRRSANKPKRIFKLSLNGGQQQIYPLFEEKITQDETVTQLSAMVQHIKKTAAESGIQPLPGPWLPPLPESLYMDDVLRDRMVLGERMKREALFSVPVGLVDDPRAQTQDVLSIDFAGEGNLFVYGASGTGKTVLMRTLCVSAALAYSPRDVHIYILDFGGGSLKPLQQLPHVGGVVTLEQEERLEQFLLYVFRLIEERKALFEQAGSEGWNDYRRGGRELPAILILVDNYFALSETYEDAEARMILLAREGSKYGIFLVANATNATLVRYKMSVNFKQAISFQLTDVSEYVGIVGRTEGLVPSKFAGRGLVRGNPPLEFQTALPELRGSAWDELVQRLSERESDVATPIPMMPAEVKLDQIQTESEKLVIGLAHTDLQPIVLDPKTLSSVMVAGDAGSGKSTLLVSWINMLRLRHPGTRVYALDSSGMGLFSIMHEPYVTDIAQLDDAYGFAAEIKELLADRRAELLARRSSGGDTAELQQSWAPIIFAFDSLSEFTNNDMYAVHEIVERIAKQERGLNVLVLAADNTSELSSNWSMPGKAIREEQTGVLLGRLKDQGLYNINLPYGTQERIAEAGDGYWVTKNKYTGLRYGIMKEQGVLIGS